MCWPRTTHRLSMGWGKLDSFTHSCASETLPNPNPPYRGGGGQEDHRWIINMLATYDLLAALHTGCASETLPSPNPPPPQVGGGVK